MTTTSCRVHLNAARAVAACVVAVGAVVVGCGSGSLHGRNAADSSGVVALSSPAESTASPSASASVGSPSASASIVDPSGGTAAALIGDHWSQLPAAPIAPRTAGVVAWTGTQLLVWGGASAVRNVATLYADGASYDPATKKWTTLPPAPLSARSDAGWVWTGSSLIVFGGYAGDSPDGSQALDSDGAEFTPATNSWRKLPTGPLSTRFDPQLLWDGGQVLVIGGNPADTSDKGPGYAIGSATYDSARNRWTTLPAMPMTAGHDVRGI